MAKREDLHNFLEDLKDWEQQMERGDSRPKRRDKNSASKSAEEEAAAAAAAARGQGGQTAGMPSGSPAPAAEAAQGSSRPGSQKKPKPLARGGGGGARPLEGSAGVVEHLAQALDMVHEGGDASPDAASEKDQGNALFRVGKYSDAMACYSRSIALCPSAVAFANRAMAALKLKRYKEAEADCDEALAMDDAYVKALSRRATARRELGKPQAAVDDLEQALQLEPGSQEIQRQLTATLALLDKRGSRAKSVASQQGQEQEEGAATLTAAHSRRLPMAPHQQQVPTSAAGPPQPLADDGYPAGRAAGGGVTVGSSSALRGSGAKDSAGAAPSLAAAGVGRGPDTPATDAHDRAPEAAARQRQQQQGEQGTVAEPLPAAAAAVAKGRSQRGGVLDAAAQAAASKAARAAQDSIIASMAPPASAYAFEAMWKAVGADVAARASILRMVDSHGLPQLFKDSLTPALLLPMLLTLLSPSFFPREAEKAMEMLEGLARVPRFHLTVLFLSSKDRAAVRMLWNAAAADTQLPAALRDRLTAARSNYKL